jgi:uncharacterized protein YebE (UPF0316 family)
MSILVATHKRCKTIRIILSDIILSDIILSEEKKTLKGGLWCKSLHWEVI